MKTWTMKLFAGLGVVVIAGFIWLPDGLGAVVALTALIPFVLLLMAGMED